MDSSSAGAYGTLGLISLIYGYDWQVATRYFAKALEIDPYYPSTLMSCAHMMVSSGSY